MRIILRSLATLFVIVSLLSTPLIATAADKKGNKNYKQGLKYEAAEQWDKAAEEFALAVASRPSDAEYRLHYRRALFNASQMMMQRGRVFAEQKNYVAGYNAYRQAFGYDPTNELAKAEMNRMLRLQNEVEDPNDPNKPKESPTAQPSGVRLVPTAYNVRQPDPPQQDIPQQLEPLRDIKFSKVDLKNVIKDLAQSLDLNVLFDSDTFRQGQSRELTIELKNVTTAQALDYIFLQEKLFFQKVGKRTVVVADTRTQRQNYQQLVLRTFYLANASPENVRNVITQAIPPQPGRPPSQAIVDKDTNSITVRDTSENIKIIADLIKAVDKDRAEVVMDVNIYEVSRNDLLQIGNQIGNGTSLLSLGGTTSGALGLGANGDILGRGLQTGINNAIATGFILPASNLVAFQSKDNTKLLASTQVHAFNNEESQARIGQRVPVQTAQLLGYNTNNVPGQPNTGNNFGNAASVFNYEQVGLTLKFTPIVFPNQDVQVKMSIESKDVATGGSTPTFTERTITGTARIQNNRTLMLASVAQDNQSNGRQGLPVLGLIPILGRLFTAPTKSNRQVDIVIAVTPRVLRSPTILPEDEDERATGSIAVPTSSSLSEMIRREDQDDQLAAARRLTNTAKVQLPDQKIEETVAPAYVPSSETPKNDNAVTRVAENNVESSKAAVASTNVAASPSLPMPAPQFKPIDTTVKTLNLEQTSEKLNEKPDTKAVQKVVERPRQVSMNVAPVVAPSEKLDQKPDVKIVEKAVELPRQISTNVTPNVKPAENSVQKPLVKTVEKSLESSSQVSANVTPLTVPSVKKVDVNARLKTAEPTRQISANAAAAQPVAPSSAEIKIVPFGALKAREKRRVAIMVNSPFDIGSGVLSLNFDTGKIIVRKIMYGDVYGSLAGTTARRVIYSNVFGTNSNDSQANMSNGNLHGNLLADLPITSSDSAQGVGVLAYVDIEALTDGDTVLQIDQSSSKFVGVNRENIK